MRNIFKVLILAGLTLSACSGSAVRRGADTSVTSTDSINEDSTAVKPADSIHSFRNDRGTDSVSAGKSVPRQP